MFTSFSISSMSRFAGSSLCCSSYQYNLIAFNILTVGQESPFVPLLLGVYVRTDFFSNVPAQFPERVTVVVILGRQSGLIEQYQQVPVAVGAVVAASPRTVSSNELLAGRVLPATSLMLLITAVFFIVYIRLLACKYRNFS